MNDIDKSISRASVLLKSPDKKEDYIVLKLKPYNILCCCFHCWPKTWKSINQYILPKGPIEDEGDVLLSAGEGKYVLECHESGPEIVIYLGIVAGSLTLINSVIDLIKKILTATQKEDRKKPDKIKLFRYRQIGNKTEEKEIMEIEFPLSEKAAKLLEKHISSILLKSSKRLRTFDR